MREVRNILVIQTAFLGDVVLTTPLVQIAKRNFGLAKIDFAATPETAGVLRNHPAINEIIVFDKRGKHSGVFGLLRMAKALKERKYDVALVPHRSMRSALLVRLAGIPRRVGFNRSTGRFLLTDVVRYEQNIHEVERNLSLLKALHASSKDTELPALYPSREDVSAVETFFRESKILEPASLIGVAPGTVWNTKRWLKERYVELVQRLVEGHLSVALIGGKEDESLCDEIVRLSTLGRTRQRQDGQVVNAAGTLSLLQSAELLRRCRLLVCNDSAPMHLAVAMRTPVVAIFGATVPQFGFAPYGKDDVVVETSGLTCRPCSIHGGGKCPIKTFVCMKEITVDRVYEKTKVILENVRAEL